jgi:cell wall-associated NlpC family hydrolase
MIKKFFLSLFITTLIITLLPQPTSAAVNLKLNSRGNAVSLLQHRLQQLNFTITTVDGIFGEETKNAVIAFQKSHNLAATGIVDTATWTKLSDAVQGTTEAAKKTTTKKTSQTTNRVKTTKQDINPPVLTSPANAAPLPAKASEVVNTAKKYLNVPYKYGGTTPSGFDCSGYTMYVFKQHGITLPRTADVQCQSGRYIAKSSLQQGDLVFFATKKDIEHCGIYVGDNSFIHASSSKGIRIDKLSDPYWSPKYYGARRVL